jgi:hypothetical protein
MRTEQDIDRARQRLGELHDNRAWIVALWIKGLFCLARGGGEALMWFDQELAGEAGHIADRECAANTCTKAAALYGRRRGAAIRALDETWRACPSPESPHRRAALTASAVARPQARTRCRAFPTSPPLRR